MASDDGASARFADPAVSAACGFCLDPSADAGVSGSAPADLAGFGSRISAKFRPRS